MNTLALRPYLAADSEILAAIFRDSIDVLAEEDYSEAQRAAWIAAADDEDEFAAKLTKALTLIATVDGDPIGFASLAENTIIDMIYVSPHAARIGAATLLCDALERLAGARGATKLSADVSDSARDFFEGRNFIATQRNLVPMGDEWLANTSMTKDLAAPAAKAKS